jgi:alpha-soluble NSF attachment protein
MGDQFKQKGLNVLKRSTFFGLWKQQNYEDACDEFIKAGNAYGMSKHWLDAGDMYSKAAECLQEINNSSEAANYYIQAGDCYIRTNTPTNAINPYLQTIKIYTESGQLSPIAIYYQRIAEILENKGVYSEAIEYYEKAGDINEAHNNNIQQFQCLLRVAILCSQKEGNLNLFRAASIFETLGNKIMERNNYNCSCDAKNYYFQCVLCYMALGDFVTSKEKLNLFKSVTFIFSLSSKSTLLSNLHEAIDEFNADKFSQACSDYDRANFPLDRWEINILIQIKSHIT